MGVERVDRLAAREDFFIIVRAAPSGRRGRPTRRERAVVGGDTVPRWAAAHNCGNPTVLLETPAIPHPKGKRGREMSSHDTRLDGQSTSTRIAASTGAPSPFGDVARLRLVRDLVGDPHAAMACAAAAVERVEQEIDHLWFDSMKAEDLAMSQRLAEVSHALQRAARLLEADKAIG
jgi:hypothetical protein